MPRAIPKDPMRRDGSLIKDSLSHAHYYQIKHEFQEMERILGALHEHNDVPYVLVQPTLGWQSDGRRPGVLRFHDLMDKGFIDPLTLFVYTAQWNIRDPKRNTKITAFLDCVERNKPAEFKLVHNDYCFYNQMI